MVRVRVVRREGPQHPDRQVRIVEGAVDRGLDGLRLNSDGQADVEGGAGPGRDEIRRGAPRSGRG